jgi:hypothetical protein
MSGEGILVLAGLACLGAAAMLWAAGRAGALADELELEGRGCYCPAGRDGFHLPGCPIDPEQEAGA